MKHLLLSLFLLAGCGKHPEPEPSTPATPPEEASFTEGQARLASQHLESGWVCSRDPGNPTTCQHAGDSLIWTGLWIGTATCAAGFESELAIQDMIRRNVGALVRFDEHRPEFDEYRGGREVSLDGALGLYAGVAQRVRRCPETAPAWLDVMTLHQTFLRENHGRLHPNADAVLPDGFDLLPALLVDRLAGRSIGGGDLDRRVRSLLGLVTGWAVAVNASHAAAFRVHLGYVTIQALEALGVGIPDAYRWGIAGFCAATRGIDIPTVDAWCGRADLADWIAGYQPNVWEFRHQRSGSWESADGDGLLTPGLDLLVALRQRYTFTF